MKFGHKLLDEVVEKCLNAGIELTLKRKGGKTLVDLDVRAKSGLEIKPNEDGSLTCYGRYQHEVTVEDWDGLLFEVKGCMNSDGYINEQWAEILVESDWLTKTVETKVTYS